MSWFSDLCGLDQEKEIADGALERHWAEEQEQYRERMAVDSWSTVCHLCGGSGGVECPDGCGGHAGEPTNCTRCGGYGSVFCPVCVCQLCFNNGTVTCLLCPPGGGCDMCEDDGLVACPAGCGD